MEDLEREFIGVSLAAEPPYLSSPLIHDAEELHQFALPVNALAVASHNNAGPSFLEHIR